MANETSAMPAASQRLLDMLAACPDARIEALAIALPVAPHVPAARVDDLRIERTSSGHEPARWAVRWGGNCLLTDAGVSEMVFEPSPGSRTDEFLAQSRFDDLAAALAAAIAWRDRQWPALLEQMGRERVPGRPPRGD